MVTTAQSHTKLSFSEDNPAHVGGPGRHVLLQKVKLLRERNPRVSPRLSATDVSGDEMEMKTIKGTLAFARRLGSWECAGCARSERYL